MTSKFLYTSECVSGGHPDKLCDYIADAILDDFISKDPNTFGKIEAAAKGKFIIVFGYITSNAEVQVEQIARRAIKDRGYISADVGLDYLTVSISVQLDIKRRGEDNSTTNNDSLPPGQGIVFGYATDETEELMPLSYLLSVNVLKKLDELRTTNELPWLRPDMKSQVTVEYEQREDGHLVPIRVDTILVSVQHSESITNDQIRSECIEKVFKMVVPQKYQNDSIRYIVNPSGSFHLGGPAADAGVTGRKLIADTYGGWGGHGGKTDIS